MESDGLRPRVLTLVTTHQCTAACDHCCFACTPRTTARIPPDRLRGLIDEACEIPSINRVCFIGGECFLLGQELIDRFAQASRLGYQVATGTNGYWAVNAVAASRIVDRSAAAGLKILALTTGEMHAKYVPPERVMLGAIAGCDAGLDVRITIEDFLGTTFDPSIILEDPRIVALCEAGRLSVSMRDWLPNAGAGGNATIRHPKHRTAIADKDVYHGCGIVLDVLTVTPNLTLAACCGYPIDSLPDVHLGSVDGRSLKQALESAPVGDLLYWLAVAGPERMLLFVKKYFPDYELPESVHPCVACVHLHRDPVAAALLRSKGPEYRDTLRVAYRAIEDARVGVLGADLTAL